jgi:predicted GH43/DUF377 family glycosyl hydrolase
MLNLSSYKRLNIFALLRASNFGLPSLNFRLPYSLLAPAISLLVSCGGRQDQLDDAMFPPWIIGPFEKLDEVNPVLGPGEGVFRCPVRGEELAWEEKDVFNPAAAARDDTVFLLYRAEDMVGRHAGTSRIGLAISVDGKTFTRRAEPVLFPDNDEWKVYEWEGGCEDPRIVEDENGIYYMTYTAYDGELARLMVASSPDLVNWTKHGPAFAKAYDGKYLDKWSKSGAIVARYYDDGRILATRVNGKFWMYWGELHLWMATSENLIDWTPVERAAGETPPEPMRGVALATPDLKSVLPPRAGMFDSDLVEPGPPAMLTNLGIIVIYNSKNAAENGDPNLPPGAYAAGQAIFDARDPTRLLERTGRYFIKPDKPYEIDGQVNQVCFVEGLVRFHNQWLLYYGTADSKIAAAVAP